MKPLHELSPEQKTLPRFRGLSTSQKRDFIAYCKNLPKTGLAEPLTTNQMVKSLAQWYWLWDTHGIRANHPRLDICWRLVQAKEHLNLTIKLWVEDIVNESYILHPKEVWEWTHSMPSWVWKSFVGQLNKSFLPFRWQQIHLSVDGITYWPPEQIEFDPSI